MDRVIDSLIDSVNIIDTSLASATISYNFSFLGGLLSGVICSLIASFVFIYLNNKAHKPKIKVADQLIEKKTELHGKPINSLLIKIINETPQDLVHIEYEVKGVKNITPSSDDNTPVYVNKYIGGRELTYISRFDKNDKECKYASQTNLYYEDLDIISLATGYDEIRVIIYATCPYYNTSTVIVKYYNVKSKILSSKHNYNSGNSLGVTSNS